MGSLNYAQVAFGAKKSKMVLFCRKSGKLDLHRKRVATTARAQTRREKRAMTRNMRGFFPTTQGTQTAVKEDSNAKKLASSILILDQSREKAYKSNGEVAKSPEEPELESAQEDVEVVGEVEGEKVRVLASAVGGREGDQKAMAEAAEVQAQNTCQDFTLLIVLILFFIEASWYSRLI